MARHRAVAPSRRSRAMLAAALFVLLGSVAPAFAAAKLSLVIGNDNYQTIGKLKNPVSDAVLIESKLRDIGFAVDRVSDASKATLSRAIRDFGRKIAAAGPGATILVYYAGHGMQDDKQTNYIIPIDADLQVQADLATEAVSLDTVTKMLEQANVKVGIVVLDACRDNPLPNKTRSAKRGLAVEERTGLYIAFSTEPNAVALDGEGAHSPYAAALAAEITSPGVEIEKVFKNVRTRVFEATNGQQKPWESSRLMQEVFLGGPAAAPAPTAAPTAAPTLDPDIEYAKAVQLDTAEGYEKLLGRFPSHPKKDLIVSLVQRKAEEGLWRQAEAVRGRPEEPVVLERLLTAFDKGIYADRARERREAIRRENENKAGPSLQELSAKAQADFDRAARANTAESWNRFLRDHPAGSNATLARYNLTLLTSRQEAPPAPQPTGAYHYVSGLDPNGDNWLSLRSAPSLKTGFSKTRMGPGTLLKVTGSTGDWLQVELMNGETGYAFSRYVACCRSGSAGGGSPAPAVRPTSVGGASYHYVTGLDPNGDNWLSLRSAPSLKVGYSKGRMGPGTLLKVVGTEGEWHQVQLTTGETGYAFRKYVGCCRAQ